MAVREHRPLRLTVAGFSGAAFVVAALLAATGDGDHSDADASTRVSQTLSDSAGLDTSPAHYTQLWDGTRQIEPERFDPSREHATPYVQDVVDSKLGRHSVTGFGNPSSWLQENYHIARLAGTDSDGSGSSLCGRAEVRPVKEDADRGWGSICAVGFKQTDAEVFCRSMGLTGGTARYTDGRGTWTWDDTAITHRDLTAAHIFQRSDYGSGTSSNSPRQPDAAKIWMTQVDCAGGEASILDCPFAGKAGEGTIAEDQRSSWIDYNGMREAGCDESSAVGLCCDASGFCPPRSIWTPSPIHSHQYAKWGSQTEPDQAFVEILANCKCDAGFFMVASSVYSGRCKSCPPGQCSPAGSTSVNDCYCLEGFYLNANGEGVETSSGAKRGNCDPCPLHSCR
jgi:hypothetical protein